LQKNRRISKRCLVIGYYHRGAGPVVNGVVYHRNIEALIQNIKDSNVRIMRYSKNYISNTNAYYGNPVSSWFLSRLSEGVFYRINKTPYASALRFVAAIPWIVELILNKINLVIGPQPPISLLYAAHLIKIPSIDVLHGYAISRDHHCYGDHNEFVSKYNLPSTICALDLYSENIIRRWGASKGIDVCSIDNYQHEFISDCGYKIIADINAARRNGKRIVLITLGWDIDMYCQEFPHEDGEIHPRIYKTLKKMSKDEMERVLFLVRPHPMLYKDERNIKKINETCNDLGVRLDACKTFSHLVGVVDTHITIGSSVTRELGMHGTKTLFFGDALTLERDFFVEHQHGIAIYSTRWPVSDVIDFLLNNKMGPVSQSYLDEILPQKKIYHIVDDILK